MRSNMLMATTVFLLFIALPTICFAGDVGKIAGKVVDKGTGLPLQYANVVVVGTRMGAVASGDGSFVILNVAPGQYSVQASFVGYKTVLMTDVIVEPDLTQTVVFGLEQSTGGVMEPIVVVAQRPLVQLDVTATRKTFLSEEITSLPVDNPVGVINFVSGSSIDAGGTHIRGGRASEVGYYIDDSPIQDPIQNNAMLALSNQAVNEMVY